MCKLLNRLFAESLNTNFTKLAAICRHWILFAAIISFLCGCCGDPSSLLEVGNSYAGGMEIKATILEEVSSIITKDTELTLDIKNKIKESLVEPLGAHSTVVVAGEDAEIRPILVNFQKAFEQTSVTLLRSKYIKKITAIIHTSKPSTPLVSTENIINQGVVHPDMINDPSRLSTIKNRVATLRDMAMHGDGMKLYIAYEQKWSTDKSFEDKYVVYQDKLNDIRNISLIDSPLACESLPSNLIGASYLIELKDQEKLLLSLTGIQAIEGSGEAQWRLWFDEITEEKTSERLLEVYSFLKEHNQNIGELGVAVQEINTILR